MTGKAPHQMTVSELRHFVTGWAGLPAPSIDAKSDDFNRWLVASFILGICSKCDDVEAGKRFAVDFVLGHDDHLAEAWRPFLGEAIGRPITDEEMEAGRLVPIDLSEELADLH
jgi:hypothetical protein